VENYVVTKGPLPAEVRMRHKLSGFSLIELLVVMAIVGILAAFLALSLTRAKGKAMQSQCANNVRQLGVALREHVIENNTYPLVIKPSWIQSLQVELSTSKTHINSRKYLEKGVWRCPAANRPANLPPDEGYESYGYNWYGMSGRNDTDALGLGGHHVWHGTQFPEPAVKETEISRPSDMMAIGDGFCGENKVIKDGTMALWRTSGLKSDAESSQRAYARHQGKASVVFCDGHVEAPTLRFLFEDTTDGALARWNRDHLPHREKSAL
jgi:prepilin-type N-terminal cleavage/methylation domain-containing protein/prepilin-type processing-associated H-X9-DG protein